MVYWNEREAAISNLRLYRPAVGWVAYNDVKDEDGKITSKGSHDAINQALTSSLHASNLLLLTGAGSSFCATNQGEQPLTAPGMTDLWSAVENAAGEDKFASVFEQIPIAKSVDGNIEKLLTLCKIFIELNEDKISADIREFVSTAESAIADRVDFVSGDTDLRYQNTLIRKIARRGNRKRRTKIFTTNYDLCFEYSGNAQRFTIIDGFSHSLPQIYDRSHFSHDIVRRDGSSEGPDYIENVFQLFKLHGSLDWQRQGIDIVRSLERQDAPPVLIYPRDSKYQEAFEPPYLDMMSAFQEAIRETDTSLLISGFGFNDDHISKPIFSALEANMSLRLVVCDVAFLSDEVLAGDPHIVEPTFRANVSPAFEKLLRLANIGDSRITLLSGRFEELALAIPDIVAQTERERHAERIRLLRDTADGDS